VPVAPPPAAPPAAAPPLPRAQTIKASLEVTRFPDTAAMNNCLEIQVNGGPPVDLGCNHGAIVPAVQIDALPKPACNQIRLILFSNGVENRTTENALSVAQNFRIAPTATGFLIQCNDNGDNDFNDLNLEIDSSDASFTIENSGFGCRN
jgi:hypothetical protein